jgi:hypothetical protein
MAIVTHSAISSGAWIEFHGITNPRAAVKDMVRKIKKILNGQIFDPHETDADNFPEYRGLYVQDDSGYYQLNIEVMVGKTSSPYYLLSPDNKDHGKGKTVLLLKISGGHLGYNYFISEVAPPLPGLDKAIKKVLYYAERDFQDSAASGSLINSNNFLFLMNRKGSYHDAIFLTEIDKNDLEVKWKYYQDVLQAALGTRYVFMKNAPVYTPYIVYFSKYFEKNKPRVYLEFLDDTRVSIKIESTTSHPINRNKE